MYRKDASVAMATGRRGRACPSHLSRRVPMRSDFPIGIGRFKLEENPPDKRLDRSFSLFLSHPLQFPFDATTAGFRSLNGQPKTVFVRRPDRSRRCRERRDIVGADVGEVRANKRRLVIEFRPQKDDVRCVGGFLLGFLGESLQHSGH
ncbi:hypothetical protein GWI33_013168 [Rhynchophorus ferrugineus]|uniref:Uncharacterized protein n=1 Tax=Rhynchophorus ferrugineus TaxID=354439 RepID=A0A834MDG9_RHYFE|nr:hypothetical protein GWI33_013168 [Rhynchophorus ferrugineus]